MKPTAAFIRAFILTISFSLVVYSIYKIKKNKAEQPLPAPHTTEFKAKILPIHQKNVEPILEQATQQATKGNDKQSSEDSRKN